MTIAITIARGGSKRFPGKNVRDFCGRPLVAWSIIQALTAHEVDRVYLSTDTDELQEIGERYGAWVIRRPDWPDADTASAPRPFTHALQTLLDKGEITLDDEAVIMLPTSPLIRPGDIDSLISEYRRIRPARVLMAIRLREAVIYRLVNPMVMHAEVYDKKHQYATLGPSVSVTSPAWELAFYNDIAMQSDAEADRIYENGDGVSEDYVGLWCEPWQALEVDTAEEFDTAAAMMEYKILHGRDTEAYDTYRGINRPWPTL